MGDTQVRHFRPIAPGMEVLPNATVQEALDALVAGHADGVVADAVSVYQYMSSRHDAVRIVATLTDESYVIVAPFKSRRLAEAIDAVLSGLRQSGALDTLRDRWMKW
jgi:ABC-type amino acid transport substrate-binding protein